MNGIDFDAVRHRHRLGEVARRTGLLPVNTTSGDVRICCPLPTHGDRTPSMVLHLSTDRYHCFGCEAHVDVIQWVRDIYGVRVGDAVRMLDVPGPLAEPPVGVVRDHHRTAVVRSFTEHPDLERSSPERVKAALAAAWDYYNYGGLHAEAVGYLRDARGIDVCDLEVEQGRRMVGHTPHKSAHQLVTRLRETGFGDDELVDAGLARRYPTGRVIDSYRDRILLAVRDDSDAVIGLIGQYDGRPTPGKVGPPKYLNPTRTVTYDKSVNLYRPSVAGARSTPMLAEDAQVILCEGTLDALAIAATAASAGRSSEFAPVAESGIALSGAQWDAVLAIHPRPPVICADGDSTGRAASAKWAVAALHRGRESTITLWPEGHDPASYLAEHGVNGLQAVTRRRTTTGTAGLRPRHAAPMVVAALATAAEATNTSVDDAVLSPLGILAGRAERVRYATAAARYLAGGVVARAIGSSDDSTRVVRAIAGYGAMHFTEDAYREWAAAAAMELDLAGHGRVGHCLRSIMEYMRIPADGTPTTTPSFLPLGLRVGRLTR